MDLLEDYISELGVFFKSGREELVDYSSRDELEELDK